MSADDAVRPTAAGTRSQHLVMVLNRDGGALAQALAPVVERVDSAEPGVQAVIVVADAEAATDIAMTTRMLGTEHGVAVVAATSAGRATRLLKSHPPQVIVGTPSALLGAIRGSALKLEGVRAIVFAWIEDTLAAGEGPDLETIMGDVPKEAARLLVATRMTPEAGAFVEQYVRRGVLPGGAVAGGASSPIPLRFVSVGTGGRPLTLRRLLDDLDPPGVAVAVESDRSESEVRDTLAALGYPSDTPLIQVTRGAAEPTAAVVILYDVPSTPDALLAIVGSALRQVIVLARPREIALVRELAGGAAVTPVVLSGAADRSRAREEALRTDVRSLLAATLPARELLTLEPLLEEFDGIEIAAALLRMLEQARLRSERAARPAASLSPTGTTVEARRDVGRQGKVSDGSDRQGSPNGGGQDRKSRGNGPSPRTAPGRAPRGQEDRVRGERSGSGGFRRDPSSGRHPRGEPSSAERPRVGRPATSGDYGRLPRTRPDSG